MAVKNVYNSNVIQFPRLLAEITAHGMISRTDLIVLKGAMDLNGSQINTIMDRAIKAFELNKGWVCPSPNDKPGTNFIAQFNKVLEELEFMVHFLKTAPWTFTDENKDQLEAIHEGLGTLASDVRELYEDPV